MTKISEPPVLDGVYPPAEHCGAIWHLLQMPNGSRTRWEWTGSMWFSRGSPLLPGQALYLGVVYVGPALRRKPR